MRDSNGRFTKGSGLKDLTGKRYGRLVVEKLDSIRNRRSYWLCKCDCGKEKVIRSDCLGTTLSCGCLKKEQDIKNLGIINNHKLTYHKAYHIWSAMMNRCFNPHNHAFLDYGGRGIEVCKEWQNLELFCKWMDEHNYEKGLSIERIDVNGNYEPNNCCLIPKNEQAWNRRDTLYVVVNGNRIPLAKEARRLGISPRTVNGRYHRGIRDYDRLFAREEIR